MTLEQRFFYERDRFIGGVMESLTEHGRFRAKITRIQLVELGGFAVLNIDISTTFRLSGQSWIPSPLNRSGLRSQGWLRLNDGRWVIVNHDDTATFLWPRGMLVMSELEKIDAT